MDLPEVSLSRFSSEGSSAGLWRLTLLSDPQRMIVLVRIRSSWVCLDRGPAEKLLPWLHAHSRSELVELVQVALWAEGQNH